MAPDDHDRHPDTDAIGEFIATSARTLEAPARLRAAIDEERWRANERAVARRVGGRRPLAALSGAAVALAAALALVLAGLPGGAAGPSLDAAAALALASPTEAAPGVNPSQVHEVTVRESGIAFPNYAYELPGWRATGVRHDNLHGRHATTVRYRGPRGTVGYTIVAGKALDVPGGAKAIGWEDGSRLRVLRRDGTTIVTWEQDGHTCVLASRSAGVGDLVRLATWS